MIQGLSTSHSGLRFAQERLRSTAHHTANRTTTEMASGRVSGHERREVGVASEVVPAARRHCGEDAAEMITAGQHFAAGVRVVQTQDEMLGALLDSEG
jgi:flagellar basal body rod protein FlgG